MVIITYTNAGPAHELYSSENDRSYRRARVLDSLHTCTIHVQRGVGARCMLGKTVLLLKSVLMRMGPPCVPYAVMDSCFLLTLHVCNH